MENKENITDYARRMRELAGLSENAEKKTLSGKQFQEENAPSKQLKESAFEEGQTFYAKDMMTPNKESKKVPGDLDINGNIIPESVNESEEKGEEFETHKFEQKAIEEGIDDEELYSLNEDTIIVLDFLNEEVEESSDASVRHGKDRKGPTDSATWHDAGTVKKGEDGNMWKIVTGSNGVNRWVEE